MPVLTIDTNVPKDKVTLDIVKRLVDVIASSLGKPKNYVVVHINAGQLMSFGGGDGFAAIGRLTSIGQINRDTNTKTMANIASLLEKELNVPPESFYLTFEDIPPANIGWKKSTFADLFG
jgi:phenylpyruvate tautomerase PptA (4-oxalocrotonate tautomerase family)